MSIAPRYAEFDALTLDELRQHWKTSIGVDVPAHSSRDLLARALAYQLEVRREVVSVRKTHARLTKLASAFEADREFAPPDSSLRPGVILVRDWNGKRFAVTALDKGFLHDGKTFGSLSAVAKAITGVAWSGPRFFKLTEEARDTTA